MRKIIFCLALVAASAHDRGTSHGYSAIPHSIQRTPSVHSFLFAPLHHARPNLKGRPLHQIPLGEAKRLHRQGLDNSVSAFI